jgi:hypothetical protein
MYFGTFYANSCNKLLFNSKHMHWISNVLFGEIKPKPCYFYISHFVDIFKKKYLWCFHLEFSLSLLILLITLKWKTWLGNAFSFLTDLGSATCSPCYMHFMWPFKNASTNSSTSPIKESYLYSLLLENVQMFVIVLSNRQWKWLGATCLLSASHTNSLWFLHCWLEYSSLKPLTAM